MTMRLTVMSQMRKGLCGVEPAALVEQVEKDLESLKWHLWNGNVDPALKLGATVDGLAREHGLIARFIGDRIAFSPPLIITEAEIDEVMARLRRALDDAWTSIRR